jgi:hypothetical protein
MPQTTGRQWKNLRGFTSLNTTRCFPGPSAKLSKSRCRQRTTATLTLLYSCLAHVINLATQTLIATYSKAPHYNPHDPKGHEPTTRDEIGLIRSICVKVRLSAS